MGADARMVPLAGIEPALLAELDFESSASTNSATGALGRRPQGQCREAGRNIAVGLPRSTRADVIVACLDRAASAGYHRSIVFRVMATEIPVTSYATAHPSHQRLAANPALSAALAVALIAAVTLAGAWFFQLVLGIVPCPLCLEQRYAYYLAVPLGLLVALVAARDAPRPVVLAGRALLG